MDIYLHPLHVRSDLVRDLNRIVRQQVGHGLWRQRWTEDGRMQDPPQGLGIAECRWELIPSADMPKGVAIMPVEGERSCIWLVRAGSCTCAMRDEMNRILERIVGDGLWVQCWDGADRRRMPAEAPAPRPRPGAVLLM
ncbi:hypothetical protein [Streptomyces sp. NPDC020489]|uniref:hypothetical protein n=1 Tax=Streptomyces sp. NPDC020489 TaxID=3365077 RepID=UPI0037AAE200